MNEQKILELRTALRWALEQIDDDLNAEHQEAMANARALLNDLNVGDKVRTRPGAFSRIAGFVVALHPETRHGHSACASVYAGGHESVKIPLSDLIKC